MKSRKVEHTVYGAGEVRATRYKGLEVQVEFEDGFLRWIRTEEMKEEVLAPWLELSSGKKISYSDDEFVARRIIEALRLGTVPYECVDGFTFGRDDETKRLKKWLEDTAESTLLVVGDYGTGKTHFLQYSCAYALKAGYAVCHAGIDPEESPFSRPKRVYRRLMQSFRFPIFDDDEPGAFLDLVKECIDAGAFEDHPYFSHLHRSHDRVLWDWLSGKELSARP